MGRKFVEGYVNIREGVGASLKEMRTKSGLTIRELGDNCNYNGSTISLLENNKKHKTSIDLATCIATHLGIDANDYFIGLTNEIPTKPEEVTIFDRIKIIESELTFIKKSLEQTQSIPTTSQVISEFHPDNY